MNKHSELEIFKLCKPMVGTPTSYTQAQSLDERLVQKNISSTIITIVSHNVKYDENDCKKSKNKKFQKQILVETPSAKAAPTRFDHCASNSNESPKYDKAPSISAITIVSHNVKYDENDCKKSKNKKAELER